MPIDTKRFCRRAQRSEQPEIRKHGPGFSTLAICCDRGTPRREPGIPVAILPCLRTLLHKARGSLLDAPPPINCDHAPCEIGAADVGTASGARLGCPFDATRIAGPFAPCWARNGDSGGSARCRSPRAVVRRACRCAGRRSHREATIRALSCGTPPH